MKNNDWQMCTLLQHHAIMRMTTKAAQQAPADLTFARDVRKVRLYHCKSLRLVLELHTGRRMQLCSDRLANTRTLDNK